MLNKLLHILSFMLLLIFILITFSFSVRERRNISCKSIEIIIGEDEVIKISKDEIAGLVKAADNDLIGKKLNNINTDLIEKEVEKHQAILKAEVYKVTAADSTDYRGIIGVKVRHRIPVARIMSSSGSYYMDRNGEIIPVSNNYAANVLVVTGYITEEFAKEQLLTFILNIEDDMFWKAQIKHVHVNENGDIILTPLVGDHLIELGSLDNYNEKLRNMKAFYEQVVTRNNWNKYEKISLKYKDQIIAKKR